MTVGLCRKWTVLCTWCTCWLFFFRAPYLVRQRHTQEVTMRPSCETWSGFTACSVVVVVVVVVRLWCYLVPAEEVWFIQMKQVLQRQSILCLCTAMKWHAPASEIHLLRVPESKYLSVFDIVFNQMPWVWHFMIGGPLLPHTRFYDVDGSPSGAGSQRSIILEHQGWSL